MTNHAAATPRQVKTKSHENPADGLGLNYRERANIFWNGGLKFPYKKVGREIFFVLWLCSPICSRRELIRRWNLVP
jgi:hypothetical protein